MKKLELEGKGLEDILDARFKSITGGGPGNNLDWIYKHDIQKVWSDYVKGIKEVHS